MSPVEFFAIAIAVALTVLALRVLIPLLWSVGVRARAHGPAPLQSSSTGGRSWGWGVSLLYSLFEHKREESWEYLRPTQIERWDANVAGPRPDPLPRYATDTQPVTRFSGDALMSRDHQQLTEDGANWWTGREWVSVKDFVPPSAPRSVDGSHWWDGYEWQWMPSEFPTPRRHLPVAVEPDLPPASAQKSWLETHRKATFARDFTDSRTIPERSDPGPTNLPPVHDTLHPNATPARRRGTRRRDR